jgi:hypothetical protein
LEAKLRESAQQNASAYRGVFKGATTGILKASHKQQLLARIMAGSAEVYSTAPPLTIILKVSRKTWRQTKRHSLEGNNHFQ